MLNKIREYLRKNRGAVLVEYVIILSFVAAIAAAIGLNNDDGLKGTAAQAAADAKTNLTNALGGGSADSALASSSSSNLEKLASGYKINRAADDASGTTTSENLSSSES